jgi:hypothetical protein
MREGGYGSEGGIGGKGIVDGDVVGGEEGVYGGLREGGEG